MKLVKRMRKPRPMAKVFILLIVGFGFKLFFSCTPTPYDPIEFDYNKILVIGIDNSGKYMSANNAIDTLYAEAVALRLTLSDTSAFNTISILQNATQSFSFQTAQADSPVISYLPRNKVVDIRIKTLSDINSTIKAGTDVTALFLCAGSDFNLYNSISHGISNLNGPQSYHKSGSIRLVLTTAVINTTAQFEVKVTFDNGSELASTTEVFTIIQPQP
jgi:hypothetical protein